MLDEQDSDYCDFCGHEGPTEFYTGGEKEVSLCDVCARSFAGNVAKYPQQYDPCATVLAQIMSQQTNYLLDKLTQQLVRVPEVPS